MKKYLTSLSVVILLFVLLGAMQGVFAAVPEPECISVTGKGIVYVDPDIASINFCIETRAVTKEAAIKENAQAADKMKQALKKYGSVTEDSFYCFEDMCNCKFVCTRCMTLCTESVNEITDISQKISDYGATSVNFVQYGIRNYTPHRIKAFNLAIEDGEAKAAKFTRNMELKNIQEIGEGQYCYPYDCAPMNNCRKKVPVECTVMLTYVQNP